MPQYSITGRSTVTPTNARAGVSLYAIAGLEPRILEVHVFNTTSTAFVAAVQRFTASTNVGAGLTEVEINPTQQLAASATGFAGHTGDSTAGDEIARASIGAAVGAGMIWTFDTVQLRIPAGTSNGIGITTPTGTGQVFDYFILWEE